MTSLPTHLRTRETRISYPTLDEVLHSTRSRRGRRSWLKSVTSPGGPFVRYAIQDDASILYGTALTWADSAQTPTFTLTLSALASGSARQGPKSGTLLQTPSGLATAVLPSWLEMELVIQYAVAPTAGGTAEVYCGFSSNATAGTANPGGLSGTDAAVSNVDVLPQLVLAGSVVAGNSIGANANQRQKFSVRPLAAYLCPVVYNNSNAGQAFKTDTGVHTLTVTPAYLVRST